VGGPPTDPASAPRDVAAPVQSFSSAVHPFRRLTDSEVALFFRAEDGKIALSGSAKLSRSYPGVDSKGTYRNGERLYCSLPELIVDQFQKCRPHSSPLLQALRGNSTPRRRSVIRIYAKWAP